VSRLLDLAVAAAREAGAMIRDDFHRPGGPRGAGDHADVDVEAEQAIRARLLAACPADEFLGEETGFLGGTSGRVWVVDPNDGTRDYLRGVRGSAVSIALLKDRRPVLGVVYAPLAPDDDGDLVAWEEGAPSPRRWAPAPIVAVQRGAERFCLRFLERCAPSRMRPMPSVAYRLALVARGDLAGAVATGGPRDWDYAGGHALLIGAGATLLGANGPVVYSADGESFAGRVFAGTASDLAARDWDGATVATPEEVPFVKPMRGKAHRDAGRLRRAQGCLLGQIAGDSLGSLVEFQSAEAIRAARPGGVRDLEDGGTFGTIAGQPTDDSEMALALARSIVAAGGYRPEAAFGAYRRWRESGPFDIGTTTQAGLSGFPNPDSQANGSLMRVSPLGILGWNRDATALARADSALTHPNPVCQDACAAFVAAIAHGINHGDPTGAWEAAKAAATTAEIRETLERAALRPPDDYMRQMGWVRTALQNAFHRLLRAPSLEEGVIETVHCGGDTDTNAAIAGALLGAVHGRQAVPLRWRRLVLTCRPIEAVTRPRPREYWPVDAMELAERLLEA
jgi:ADP-ribosylglycohydrolase/fructose-1,6-bisphosphatase/inositol monophosphatase family enzyme